MATPRLNIPPPQPISIAQLGYNTQNVFNTTSLTALKASGATIVRWQPSWGSSAPNQGGESPSSPGTYDLGTSTETALAYCGANGLKPIAVIGYGSPFTRPLSLTVGAAGAAVNDLVVPISSGNLGSIVTPTDHIQDNLAHNVTAKGAYYGGLIDSVDVPGGTITLASRLTVGLTSGQTLLVNRLAYASPADALLTNPSLIAYFNYMQFVASRIAANGATGWVALWNEPPWGNDPWDARGKMYDTPPGGMNVDTRMKMFLQYILAGNVTLPAGVRIINGASDKSGGSGMIAQGLAPTAAQVSNYIPVESIHPYHNLPEGSLWDRNYPKVSSYQSYGQIQDVFANFGVQSFAEDAANVGLQLMETETGLQEADDTRQAIYLLRRVPASWASKVIPVIYSFSKNDGSNYGVANADFTARTAYTALQSLMTIITSLGGPGGSPRDVPFVVGWKDQLWPLMGAGIYGQTKAVLFIWQRTGAEEASLKLTAPLNTGSPITTMPCTVPFSLPSGTQFTLTDPTGTHAMSPFVAPVPTLALAATKGDPLITVNSLTPNFAYPVGSPLVPQWTKIPTPATYSAQFAMPSGKTLQSATDVLTGAALTTSLSSGVLTVNGIGESPGAIVVG